MGYESLVESRLAEHTSHQDNLVKSWKPYIDAVDSYLKDKEGRNVTQYEKRNVAQCLENALLQGGMRNKSRLFETTDQSNISFLGIQLPVIAAWN